MIITNQGTGTAYRKHVFNKIKFPLSTKLFSSHIYLHNYTYPNYSTNHITFARYISLQIANLTMTRMRVQSYTKLSNR
jgi:hypothetical protein